METAGSDRVSSFSEVTSHTSGTVSINDNMFCFHVSNFKDQENHTLLCPIHLEVPIDGNSHVKVGLTVVCAHMQ